VSRAVQNLVQPDVLQSQAVDVRMELDLRIGKFQNRGVLCTIALSC